MEAHVEVHVQVYAGLVRFLRRGFFFVLFSVGTSLIDSRILVSESWSRADVASSKLFVVLKKTVDRHLVRQKWGEKEKKEARKETEKDRDTKYRHAQRQTETQKSQGQTDRERWSDIETTTSFDGSGVVLSIS